MNDCKSKPMGDNRQNRLMLLLGLVIGVSVFALCLSGFGRITLGVLVIAIVLGGAISILGRNSEGNTPLVIIGAAILCAVSAEILGIHVTGYDPWYVPSNIKDSSNFEKANDVLWYSFYVALFGAIITAFGCWLVDFSKEDHS